MKKILGTLAILALTAPSAFASDFLAMAKTIPLEVPANTLTFEWDFVASAYYSPLADQDFYLTGNFESEKVLNGNGTNGASGAEVFHGMIAAPSTLPFGTKIYIPGIGLGNVQDRGGAIKNSRIDVWMGAGESALERALSWGKRAKHCTVYLPGADIPDAILNKSFADSYLFQDVSLSSSQISTLKSNSSSFTRSLKLGDRNSEVQTLQKALQALDYLDDFPATIYFGAMTKNAVTQFQLDQGIIDSASDSAAGLFGPQTSSALISALDSETPVENVEDAEPEADEVELSDSVLAFNSQTGILATGGPILDFDQTLTLGDSGPEVKELQEALKIFGYFHGTTTEYFGLKTATAIFAFQIEKEIVTNQETPGAGYLGPITKRTLQNTPTLASDSDSKDELELGTAISALR